LRQANEGMDMNNLVLRKPNIVLCSDSCPHGLRGYSSSGFAWRFYIPGELLYHASNNLLEHIAMIITTWVEVLAGRIKREDCVLSMTDSSTSEGWTRKSNFKIDPVDADCDFDPIEAEVSALISAAILPSLPSITNSAITPYGSREKITMCQMLSQGTMTDQTKSLLTFYTLMSPNRCQNISTLFHYPTKLSPG
jgi:hypothetical protein